MSIENKIKDIENLLSEEQSDLNTLLRELVEAVEQRQIENCNSQVPSFDYRSFLNNNAPRVSNQIDWNYGQERVRKPR